MFTKLWDSLNRASLNRDLGVPKYNICKSIPFMQSIDVMIFLYGCCSIRCCCCSRMVWLPQKQCSERSHTIVDILFGVSEMQKESFFSSHIGYFGWRISFRLMLLRAFVYRNRCQNHRNLIKEQIFHVCVQTKKMHLLD